MLEADLYKILENRSDKILYVCEEGNIINICMKNYLTNNLVMLSEYEELYQNGIDVPRIVEKFNSEQLLTHNACDYGRFRVFIDSCLLLLNRDEFQHLFNKTYTYKDFYNEIEKEDYLKDYFVNIKEINKWIKCDGVHLYYSMEGKLKSPWDEVATIRNAMAHMQYGNFTFADNGCLAYYYLYNKDKGIRKDSGIVFEPVLHHFIQRYFSNYSYGVLHSYTCFLKYSIKKRKRTMFPAFYQISGRDDVFSTDMISDIAHTQANCDMLFSVLRRYEDKLIINELPIYKIPYIKEYNKLAWKKGLYRREEYFKGLKCILDFNTELSNFLVHIGRLNDILYQYRMILNSSEKLDGSLKEYKEELCKMIWELREDEHAKLIFEIGFEYLRVVNLVLRIEDDDFEKLNLEPIEVSMFNYLKECVKKYACDNDVKENKLQRYILERMRNAVMHAHVNIKISRDGNVAFVFRDENNKRKEQVEIELDRLKEFLKQDGLYNNVSQNTTIVLGSVF